MEYVFIPTGVCSRKIIIDYNGNIINSVSVVGGCDGNSKGVASLLQGYDIDSAIKKLEGIKCGFKDTSCPDQIAKALINIKQKRDE